MDEEQPGKDALSRRDFLESATLAAASVAVPIAAVVPGAAVAAAASPRLDPSYPPALQGMRGQNDAALKYAHALRDGTLSEPAKPTGETYDLAVVGGGLSGLASAYFFRKRFPHAKILILDNHDDFGGHARRNEFTIDGKMQMTTGGGVMLWGTNTYAPEHKAMLADIGLDINRYMAAAGPDFGLYGGMRLRTGLFFEKQAWGVDRLVPGYPGAIVTALPGPGPAAPATDPRTAWTEFLAKAPVDKATADDLLRIATDTRDHLPGLATEQKIAKLRKISYEAYLKEYLKVGDKAIDFYQRQLSWTTSNGGAGTDSFSAWHAFRIGYGGFLGLGLPASAHTSSSFLPESEVGPPVLLPDGLHGVARLLVRWLIPAALPGSTMEDAVTAKLNYKLLDVANNPVRLRLSSTVIQVKHVGDPATADQVEISYVRDGRGQTVRAANVVMASFNNMVPYLCPELPEEQKAALHMAVRKPLVTVNVAIRNWHAFVKAGVDTVICPTGPYRQFTLNFGPGLGSYKRSNTPDQPTIVQFVTSYESPGLPARDQFRAGRTELLTITLADFERNARDVLQRSLGQYGFNSARDITGITVNRWGHGYAGGANDLYDAEVPRDELPWVKGRKRFGRIAIANSDAAANASSQSAFDQASRAVGELIADVIRPEANFRLGERI